MSRPIDELDRGCTYPGCFATWTEGEPPHVHDEPTRPTAQRGARFDLNAARERVAERLGHEWQIAHVESTLVPGPTVGAPTQQRVRVALDFNMEGRPAPDGLGWAIGPHLVYEGEGSSLEDALAVAFGETDKDAERREAMR